MLTLSIVIVVLVAMIGWLMDVLFDVTIGDVAHAAMALSLCRWRGHRRSRNRVTKEATTYRSRCRWCGRAMSKSGKDGVWTAKGHRPA